MGLRCLELKRLAKSESSRRAMVGKQIESNIKRELINKLDGILSDYDSVEIEIAPKVVTEFINILDSDITNKYDYQQIDDNKFIFRNKEIRI